MCAVLIGGVSVMVGKFIHTGNKAPGVISMSRRGFASSFSLMMLNCMALQARSVPTMGDFASGFH